MGASRSLQKSLSRYARFYKVLQELRAQQLQLPVTVDQLEALEALYRPLQGRPDDLRAALRAAWSAALDGFIRDLSLLMEKMPPSPV